MDFWGRTGGVSVVLPYAFANTSSGSFQASTSGVSDIGFLWQMNIFGGPALTREQFQSFIPQTFSSFHLYVGTPLGTYSANSPINPSANRWTISPTINYSYTPDQGWTWLETYVSALLFTDNNNFRVNGAQTLSQTPIFRVEEHASRNLTDKLWLSADAYYNLGGETSIDGIKQNNAANTLKSVLVWGCVFGAAETLLSTMSVSLPSLLQSHTRRRCVSPSGSFGDTHTYGCPLLAQSGHP